MHVCAHYEQGSEGARVHERKERERVIERLRLTCLLVKRCRLPHQCLMLVLPGAGKLFQKGEKREEGESRKKGRVDAGFFFFM